jgi:hypothetical protein
MKNNPLQILLIPFFLTKVLINYKVNFKKRKKYQLFPPNFFSNRNYLTSKNSIRKYFVNTIGIEFQCIEKQCFFINKVQLGFKNI